MAGSGQPDNLVKSVEELMEISDSETILVIGSIGGATEEKRQERGMGGKLISNVVQGVSVPVLKKNMESFFNQIKEILDSGTDQIGAFQISEIQVYAQITGDGQVALMGSGVKIEALGGIKFTLCRIPR
jgi:hypothetical protein